MSVYETYTFKGQLDQIVDAQKEMATCHKNLRDFINSPDFQEGLPKKRVFDDLTSKMQASLVTLAESSGAPLPPIPEESSAPFSENGNGQRQRQMTLPEAAAAVQQSFSYSRAAIIIAILAVSGIVTAMQVLPPAWFVFILAGALALLFFDQIKSILDPFLSKDEQAMGETTDAMRLEQWIIDSFISIRDKYQATFLLAQVQTPNSRRLPGPTPDALASRKTYFETTLPTEFLAKIDQIIYSCNKNVWARKQVLINAIAVTKSAAAASGARS